MDRHYRNARSPGDGDASNVLHTLFSIQARKNPCRIAVSDSSTRLTYEELDRHAEQIAFNLRFAGIKPGSTVGILVERSVRMISAILGVLKAGAAYLPLDLALPPKRIGWMLSNSGTSHVISEGEHRRVIDDNHIHVFDIQSLLSKSDSQAKDADESSSDGLAYIIYTSGSTGTPNGVPIRHRQVAALIQQTSELFNFSSRDTWTLFHSISFDFSVWEIFGSLLNGAHLVVVSHSAARDPAAFLRLINTMGVTILNQTPSAFAQLVSVLPSDISSATTNLRLVIFGGERLSVAILKPWLARFGLQSPLLVNMYGITEVTVHASYHGLTEDDFVIPDVSVVGRPLPGYRFHLLDDKQEPTPLGSKGELYIAGSGVGCGYIARDRLSSERFLNLSQIDSGTLYKTGDLLRQQENGDFVYVGRADEQLKVRGYRIEPGEIEMHLNSHPKVTQSTVIARDFGQGDVRLTAFILAEHDCVDSSKLKHSLRKYVSDELPSYMHPSTYVLVERMPLTFNGKVDRNALALYEKEFESSILGSSTPDRVCNLWREVLCIDPIPLDADFFDMGGTSVALVRLLTRVSETLQVTIPVFQLLSGVTVKQMAAVIDNVESTTSQEGAIP